MNKVSGQKLVTEGGRLGGDFTGGQEAWCEEADPRFTAGLCSDKPIINGKCHKLEIAFNTPAKPPT